MMNKATVMVRQAVYVHEVMCLLHFKGILICRHAHKVIQVLVDPNRAIS